jgi:hypothetical protein
LLCSALLLQRLWIFQCELFKDFKGFQKGGVQVISRHAIRLCAKEGAEKITGPEGASNTPGPDLMQRTSF